MCWGTEGDTRLGRRTWCLVETQPGLGSALPKVGDGGSPRATPAEQRLQADLLGREPPNGDARPAGGEIGARSDQRKFCISVS